MPEELEFEDDAAALYRLYDAEGALLYIGVTDAPAERMVRHAKTQPWWHTVARKTMVWYPARADADEAETEAIQSEHPKYNKLLRSTSNRSNVARDYDVIGRYDAGEMIETPVGYFRKKTRENLWGDLVLTAGEEERLPRERNGAEILDRLAERGLVLRESRRT